MIASADRGAGPTPCAARRRTRGCRGSSTSSRRPCRPSPCASSAARTARRSPPRTGPARTRGGGRSGRCRRRGGRSSCRARAAPSALHSMCQPGRPGPHIVSHDGSSGADGCHSTKSSGSRLFGSSTLPPRSAGEREHLVARVVADRAEAGELRHVEVHRAAGLVGVAPVEHHADEPADVGDRRRGPRRRTAPASVLSASMSRRSAPPRRRRGRGSARRAGGPWRTAGRRRR